jgi:SAM-dependent methyltransferase
VRTATSWERYWSTVGSTGRSGEVIWDADSDDELGELVEQARALFDPALPVVDLGCGNGRYSRALAAAFPRVLGLDVSASAIDRAREESRGLPGLSFEVLDAAGNPDLLGDRLPGPANIFVRGVLHVLPDDLRAGVARTVERLAAGRGAVLVVEPAYREGAFGYLGFVGGSRGRAASLVTPLESAGVRHSRGFGADDLARHFPTSTWEHVAVEEIGMAVVDPESDGALRLPGFLAALRPAGRAPGRGVPWHS